MLCKSPSEAVPESTVSGTQRSRLTGNDWRILTKPTARGSHADGVVVKPLSDTSLCFETCVIMRADNVSRLANEYVRMFLRKYDAPPPVTKPNGIVAVPPSCQLEKAIGPSHA